jgi:hypothetical protein
MMPYRNEIYGNIKGSSLLERIIENYIIKMFEN